jgi:hypothetical protein
MASHIQGFLQYLGEHPEARKKLYDAVDEDILEAAKKAGFPVKRSELDELIRVHCQGPAENTWSY